MDLSESPRYEEAWAIFADRLGTFLESFGDPADSLILSFAGVPQRGEVWNPEWDHQNGPWANLDVDDKGRIRTSCGSNQFLAEPFRLTVEEAKQMINLGFAEPVIDPEGWSSWNDYFLRYDEQDEASSSLITESIAAAFRGPFRTPHPSLIEYMAFGRCATAAKALGLMSFDEVIEE